MLSLVFAALAVAVSASFLHSSVLDDSLIERINADPSIPWTAGRNLYWEGKTRLQARRILTSSFGIAPNMSAIPEVSKAAGAAPESFDSRSQWNSCTQPIRNQGQCGSCWTFGAAEEFSWRRCIAGLSPYDMSTQYIVSCDKGGYGCQGGFISQVQQWLSTTGTTTQSCNPYISGDGSNIACPSKCQDGSAVKMYKQIQGSIRHFSTPEAIRAEISTNGPLEAGFEVYNDFMHYKSGVYIKTPGATLDGGHAILIIGYGKDLTSGIDYYICTNSWGSSWGDNGYFKIGVNQCGIGTTVYGGCPEGGNECNR